MSNFKRLFICISILFCGAIFMNDVLAYEHEVWQSGSLYYWKTFDVTRGSSSDLAVAVEGAMGSGNRDVHVTTSGTLRSTLDVVQPGVRLYCHGNTFTANFDGIGIMNNGRNGFEIYDLTLRNVTQYGIRCSGASDLRFVNVKTIDIGWIGMRIDSRSSNPWDYTIYNLYMRDCHFENCGSHGLETYSIDGVTLEGTMTARNCGECGVLFNQSKNGTVGTVNAYNCCWGGGYAGLRFANGCSNITVQKLIADHCGRGYFVVKTGPTVNCHLNNAEIRECSGLGIWIENGTNCSVKSGCCESAISVSGSGSYVNVSSSCSSSGGTVYQFRNRSTGQYIDGMGRTINGDAAGQWGNTTHPNAQWRLVDAGSGYSYIVNVATNMKLDGYGRTSNGSVCAQYSNSTTHPNAQWRFIDAGSGYYFIENRGTGMRLDGYGLTDNGSDLMQYHNTTHPNAQWQRIAFKSATNVTGILENEADALRMYPNPAVDNLYIRLPANYNKNVSITVFNSAGSRLIMKDNISADEYQLDLSSINSGIYILVVSNGKESITQKFSKH
ncbi:MAG: RICIN domain-containing protein [Bacteroidales bacterium]|nr:RICIN domain-containing protein [Bacteroidales bacterium]